MTLVDDIRDGLDRGEMVVDYLPTVTLADGWCVGAEALVRWRRGDVPHRELAAAVAGTSVAGRMTYWVVEQVASDLDSWLAENPEAHVSIHVPAEILGRGGLEYAAMRSGLKAHEQQIVLELAEHRVPDQMGLEVLNVIASRGVRIALDNVALTGTNLALLLRADIHMIKLGAELVAEISPELPPPEWLPGLKALLGASSLEVVAQGVASEYQVRWLRASGVQMAQGPHFSGPLDAAGLRALYASQRENG